MPSVKSFETDMKRARRKKRAKRNIKNLTFVLAVVMVLGLVYLSRDAWLEFFDGILDKHQHTALQYDGTLEGGNYPIDISKKTNTRIGKMSKNWTLFADTTFYVYDSSGDIVYSAQAPYSNPIVEESGKRALVYDQGGYNFTVAGPRDTIYSKRLTNQILLGAIGPDGSAAIVTADEKYISYLTIYDKSGSEIYHWADGTMITAVDIAENGKGCLVSCSYARGGTFRSVVSRLDFSSTEVPMQTVPLETLGFEVRYCDGGFWLLGRDRLYRLNSDGGVEFNLEYDYELSGFDLGDKLAVMIFETADGSGGTVTVASVDGSDLGTAAITSRVDGCYVTDKAVYILSDGELDAFDRTGNLLATAPLSTPYRAFSVLGDDVYLLGYRSVEKIEFSI